LSRKGTTLEKGGFVQTPMSEIIEDGSVASDSSVGG
jgi:hypothetical protein